LTFRRDVLRRWAATALALAVMLAGEASLADVVPVVSSKSAIKSLTLDQVADIFLGRVSHFPNGLLAVPIDLRDGSPERDQFYERIAGKSPAQVRAYWSKIIFTGRGQPPKAVSTDVDMKKLIAENLTAIGYIDASLIDDTVRAL
jgi:ABC-type phosphate transport system substrate-binding protein